MAFLINNAPSGGRCSITFKTQQFTGHQSNVKRLPRLVPTSASSNN